MLADLEEYSSRFPEDAEAVARFGDFLQSHPSVFERSHVQGHFTGSAWLVSADGEKVLLMHHRKLDRWLQPGGHADGDSDLARVALREAQEETGVIDLRVGNGIFDVDRHRIMARADEAEHWHYDVRYVLRAGTDDRFAINGESRALAWRPVVEVAADTSLDASLRRMARKWLLHP
ncbi:NUDIX hydrolase [Rhodanobacter terrae]|uniref:NUDIX hydrolase n=1 Tax=Rhodanobacter terrae TaxID=418647 RepID=A0ABW0SW91_9GAMM